MPDVLYVYAPLLPCFDLYCLLAGNSVNMMDYLLRYQTKLQDIKHLKVM